MDPARAFLSAVLLALPTRIEIERSGENGKSLRQDTEALLRELVQQVWGKLANPTQVTKIEPAETVVGSDGKKKV